MDDQKVMDLLKTLADGIYKRFDEVDNRLIELEQRFDKFEAQNRLEHQQLMQAIHEVDNSRFEISRVQ